MNAVNNLPKVTFYFAVLLPQPTRRVNGKLVKGHMGGYLNAAGEVSVRGSRCSLDRSEIEARAAIARAKNPSWVVEIRSSVAPAAMFNGNQRQTHDPRIDGYNVEFLGAKPPKAGEDY